MRSYPDRTHLLDGFIATSPAMLGVLARMDTYARARTPIVLVGATGTGKTTLAELLHALSGRPGTLTTRTAGEFDPHLERSQIFGHERGAFTDAVGRHLGIVEEAGDGTLLLDDFHHLTTATQTLFLRVLDRGAFRRLGATGDLPMRCRVIIGLNAEPDRLVDCGLLLDELRYRLGYHTIRLPPLDERREDIPALAHEFLTRCPHETGCPGPTRLASEVTTVLQTARWPGNLRQLMMVIKDAYLRAHGASVVRLSHLADLVTLPFRFERRGEPRANTLAIQEALKATRGHVRVAARLLRTSPTTIYAYLAAPHARDPSTIASPD